MPRSLASPEHLFDRTWRPGHPFRPRLSRWRRAGMGVLLVILCSIIGGYGWVTDSTRVKGLAQEYLSRLVGGHVVVGSATLSIFQGLRLNDVKVFVDRSESDDAMLFRAQAFLVRVNARALLDGRVEATQIVAIEPYVKLTEDLDTGRWKHQELKRPDIPQVRSDHPQPLPEVTLRNAIVEYGQLKDGRRLTRGSMAIEGQLKPAALEPETYFFKLQSRGGTSQGVGPSVEGKLDMGSGLVSASMMNFKFGEDLEAMLPAQVRQWWKDHGLQGRVEVPELIYRPGHESYRAEIDLRGVRLVVRPHEWLSTEELRRDRWLHGALDAMRAAGMDDRGFVSELDTVIAPSPITLEQVTGKFVFTETTIEVQNVSGYVESNGIKIQGEIRNWTAPLTATAKIRVASMDSSDIVIPASPRYINSMPQPVREIYDHLRPRGHCRFSVLLQRTSPDARPLVEGEVDVLNGSFTFDDFPYPIDGATGKLVFGTDPATQEEKLDIVDVRGHGPVGGPNENARIKVTGSVSPFGPETHVRVKVEGDDIVSEPMLFNAFPRATQTALKMFDAPGKGQYPKFRGGFSCDIERPRGLRTHWNVVTQIRLEDAEGQLVVFPYPMSGVTGELTVTDDCVKIGHATMKKNGATLQIDGQVTWKPDRRRDPDRLGTAQMQSPVMEDNARVPSLKPELRIAATNVPIDADLLSAMPANQREWLKKLGLEGRFDLDGVVSREQSESEDVGFDFRIKLHDGAIWPVQGTSSVAGLNGTMRLMPGRMIVESIAGKRGEADVSGRGSVSWTGPAPEIAISADAKNLLLDEALHDALPQVAKDAWEQVKPEGTLDAALTYSGALGDSTKSAATQPAATQLATTQPATTQPANAAFQLVLTPRKLAATPKAVPYRLEELGGSVTVSSQKIVLQDVAARHGDATIKLSATATQSEGESGPNNWEFQIAAQNVAIDDELKKALPAAMTDLIKTLKMTGRLGFEFDKLAISPSQAPATKPATQPSDRSLDIDFAVRLQADKASMDVGVPLTDIEGGVAQFSGVSRNGTLSQLSGSVELPSLTLAGRAASSFKAKLLKPTNQDLLRISEIETKIADGEMAGRFDCTLGDQSPARFALALVLRNADVKALTGESAELKGRLSASLALEGAYNDAASRRGRGDVSVIGERMYRIPLILGLLQVTNLAMPVTTPFNEGTARYSVDGNRVTFETIELRAKDMLMQGSGHLDFGTKQVRLTFVTDNTTWPKLPIIGDLLQGARHELLQVHVKGTLQDPKVTASAFGTVTTTVDEVFRAGGTADNRGEQK